METDVRSSLGQSASETEEDAVSVSKKEVRSGVRKQWLEGGLGTEVTPLPSARDAAAAVVPVFVPGAS